MQMHSLCIIQMSRHRCDTGQNVSPQWPVYTYIYARNFQLENTIFPTDVTDNVNYIIRDSD